VLWAAVYDLLGVTDQVLCNGPTCLKAFLVKMLLKLESPNTTSKGDKSMKDSKEWTEVDKDWRNEKKIPYIFNRFNRSMN
jgi:hypothetical protein